MILELRIEVIAKNEGAFRRCTDTPLCGDMVTHSSLVFMETEIPLVINNFDKTGLLLSYQNLVIDYSL